MFTAAAVSPGVTAGEMLFSVITLSVVYGVMLVIEGYLMVKYVRGGAAASMPELSASSGDGRDAGDGPDSGEKQGDVLAFAY
jgi:cytochrome d ubiquinol oxidase subunit I